jgi:hypothetical protein
MLVLTWDAHGKQAGTGAAFSASENGAPGRAKSGRVAYRHGGKMRRRGFFEASSVLGPLSLPLLFRNPAF